MQPLTYGLSITHHPAFALPSYKNTIIQFVHCQRRFTPSHHFDYLHTSIHIGTQSNTKDMSSASELGDAGAASVSTSVKDVEQVE